MLKVKIKEKEKNFKKKKKRYSRKMWRKILHELEKKKKDFLRGKRESE
jgi:ribosomal protein L18E